MRSVRLIPVVIFAALALLVFKGIGIVTNGGYVLTGTTVAAAEGGTKESASSASGDPTLTDNAPTLQDSTPVLGASESGGHGGAPAEAGHAADGSASEAASSSDGGHGASSSTEGGDHGAPAGDHGASAASASAVPCLNPDAAPTAKPEGGGDGKETPAVANDPACQTPSYPVDANGDAVPMQADNQGHVTPLQEAGGENSQQVLEQRLAERRAELDKRELDLQTREALLQAAEKKLDERTQQLAAMQAQIDALVAQKQAADDEGFKAIVAMYEQMKPKQAATIFDTLAPDVLLRVARAMNPRKMAPILAVMSPAPAEALTTALATAQPDLTVPPAANGENLAALPQIKGQ